MGVSAANHKNSGDEAAQRRKYSGGFIRILSLLLGVALVVGFHAPTAMGQANVTGTWQTLSTQMPINPVHTALLYNGKILVVSGSGNYPPQTTYNWGIWDPATKTLSTTGTLGWDMFCNGMVVLPDGRPFIVGGNLQYDPFHGWKRAAVYDPATGKFTDMEDMAHGRWYPTATEMGDGRVLTFSGLDENGATNSQTEIYKVGVGWAAPIASWTPPLYPRMHLLPDGDIFYSGLTTQSRLFYSATNSWSPVIATTNYGGDRTYGSSVLLPLTPANNYKPRVMILGGGNPSTTTTEIIDLSVTPPVWVNGPAMSMPRIEMNATLLPTGKVLALGGSLNDEDITHAAYQADLYDSVSNTMSSAGTLAYARLYHSVSLLLPDGTVWVAGGNPNRGSYELNMEIYSPPYLFKADGTLATRPTISSVSPTVIGYGSSFQVQTPDAANISSVVLMKNGAVTHAFDMDQRMVGLTFTAGSGVLNVTGPPNGNTAPPGYYMLFLINSAGVPSVAKFVHVLNATGTPPTGTINSPATDVTIAPGQSVTFAGSGVAPSGSITGYSWVFRGGSPSSSNLANPGAVTFPTVGTYTVAFTVTDSAGNTDPSPPVRTITVTTVPAPALTSVSPSATTQGVTNLSVVLTGSNFSTAPTCGFGAGITIASCTYNSATKITAVINVLNTAAPGARNVTVTNNDGQVATLTNGFTVQQGTPNPAPTLSSASPNSGYPGQSNIAVTLNGTNFMANPTCDFDSDQGLTATACVYNSPTKITATLSISGTAVLGAHTIVVTDADGQSASLVNGFTVTAPPGVTTIGLGNGFTAGSMKLNGSASISGTSLVVTDTVNTYEAGSAWYPTAVNIQNFATDFQFQLSPGLTTADGFTWMLQNTSTTALGGQGGALGSQGIGKSVAVKFDLYSNSGEGVDSTGIYLNGAAPTTPAVNLTGTGIDLHSGDPFRVHFSYDGTNLVMTITDATSKASFTQTWAVDIPGTVGANTAYAGFTGGTGGSEVLTKILNWTMSTGTSTGTVATPAFSPAAGTYLGTQTVTLSDTTSGAAIFYTTDGTQPGTTAGGSTQQYSGPLTVSATETIKALATASGQTTSATGSATYTIESQVATPTFSPAAGTYSSTQTVTISTASAGATIYYTTDGTTPTSNSTAYSAPLTVSSTQTLKAFATKSGYFDSSVSSAAYTINSSGGTSVISFGSGFAVGSMALNGSAKISGTSLVLTDTVGNYEAGTAWYPTLVNIQNFSTDFQFQMSAGSSTADGFTWVLQNNSTGVLGGQGGELGYTGIGKSIAVKFDLYNNAGEGVNSTGLFLNGVSPTTPAVDLTGTGIDLHSGDVFKVHISYDGTNLTMTIQDASTNAVFTKAWAVNIPGTVGGNTAYAGFGGGTGGSLVLTKILNWTMSTGTSTPGTVATPTFSPAAGTYSGTQTVTLSDTTSGATIFYTTDGTQPATTTGGSTLQYSSPITVSANETIKALATASGQTTSATASATYTITTQVATPAFSPAAGNYTTTQTITITTTTAGATIYYTTDGTTPTSSSAVYSTPLTVSATQTVKAYAVKSGYADSAVATAAYTIGPATKATVQYEVESPAVFNASVSSGPTYRAFAWDGFTDGQGTTLDGTAVGQYVSITLNVPQAGTYDVKFASKCYVTRAIVQLSVNGVNVGPAADEYANGLIWKQFDLGNVSLPAGNVAFVFKNVGKNAASSTYTQAFDYILLTQQ